MAYINKQMTMYTYPYIAMEICNIIQIVEQHLNVQFENTERGKKRKWDKMIEPPSLMHYKMIELPSSFSDLLFLREDRKKIKKRKEKSKDRWTIQKAH